MTKEKRKIVRANGAGVFFGEVAKVDGTTVTMKNVRNIWYWSGAAGLNGLAQEGTSDPGNCKFTVAVDEITLFNVIEILSVSEKAAASIDGVVPWRA